MTRLLLIFTATFLVLAATGRPTAAGSPWDDATAVWHMADTRDSAGAESNLTPQGDVKLNASLSDEEQAASKKRGGDGKAAEFKGGWLSAGQGADGELNITGDRMSIYLRVRDASGNWNAPLFSKHGGSARLV